MEGGETKTSLSRFPVGQGFVFLMSKGRSCSCFHEGNEESLEGLK